MELLDFDFEERIERAETLPARCYTIAYDRGRYSVRRENGVHHFHSLWNEFMRRS
jgi:hypothetical protein